MLTAMPHASAVVDEPAHLTSGYLSLVQGDLVVNREHPPLVKALAAVPLLRMRPALPPDRPGEGPGSAARAGEDFEFDYSRRFLFGANDADKLLSAARLPIVLLTLAAGLTLFLWARPLLGGIGATAAVPASLAALALFAFEPNLLAHGRLVTTDMGAALFALAAFACLERGLAATGAAARRWAIASGAALGLAMLTRFSSLLLVPLMVVAAVLDRRRPAGARAFSLGAALVCALVLVNVGYGFTGGLFPLAHAPIASSLKTQPLAAMEASPLLRWLPLPLPRLFLEGLDLARHKNLSVEGPGYLNGSYSSDGWWSYFVAALAMKTTLPMLALAALGLALSLQSRQLGTRQLGIWVALPALGFLTLVTAVTRAQIGLRYVLPVIPFLCLAGGAACSWLARLARLARPQGRARRAGVAIVVILLTWHAGEGLAIHPYHLAYFNQLAGGPDRGYLHLVDSNLDWGQDLVGLGRFMRENGMARINLFYFGTADPAEYGIQRSPLEPGYYAVSATHLMGVYLPDHDMLSAFRAMVPVAIIGHSIFIYHLDEVPPSLQRR